MDWDSWVKLLALSVTALVALGASWLVISEAAGVEPGQSGAAVDEMTERTCRHLDESSNELLDSELEVRLEVMRALARDLDDV